ncbi:DUF4382 domain-containing protein [Candidatus Woesearchaeota archaeon]|nr:DUF4382 domain-containing protein [Candidatus Woesearchaeota archaeon]
MRNIKLYLIMLFIPLLLISGCYNQTIDQQPNDNNQNNDNNNDQELVTTGEGRVIFGVTDLGVDTSSITSIRITIDKIEVHNSDKGWIKVMNTSQTVDLVTLDKEDIIQLLSDIKLEAGTYQQIRLVLSNILVTDSGGLKNAMLPSSEVKIIGNLNVNPDSISTVTLDFNAADSIHIAGNGKYIFAPVIKLETRKDADVNIVDDVNRKLVQINNGKVDTSLEVGMDIDGNTRVGLKIPKDKKLTIKANNKISIGI